jgi:ATP-binding cassette subfamily B protein
MNTLRRLIAYAGPHQKQLIITYICLTAVTGLNLIVPWLIKQVIDRGLGRGDHAYMLQAALLIVGISLVRMGFSFGQRYGMEALGQLVAYDVRNAIYNHVQRLSFAYHTHAQTGQLMSRMSEDIGSVQRFVGGALLDALNILVLLVGIIAILLRLDWQLALIALIPMPFLGAFVYHFGQQMRPMWRSVSQEFAQVSAVLQENLTGVQVVRAFAREPFEIEKFDVANRDYMDTRLRTLRFWGSNFPFMMFLISLSTALILWFGGPEVMSGRLTLGTLVALNSYVLMLAGPVQRLGNIVNMTAEAMAAGDRIFEVLDTVPEIRDAPAAITLPTIAGHVRFEDVQFRYVDSKLSALQGINFDAQPGQMIALVGHTGAGKSTLINLIPRFYDVTAGRVLIDGHDVRQVTLHSLRHQIGIVLQDTLLFSATLRENIAYGRPDATMEDVITVARAADAHEFISSFPKGYDTEVGERGITLSGGQRQRVAIARALLMNPRILILDDSTSSVDTETEYQIQQALANLMRGRTSFVIAQRLTTVKNADQILVLDHGRIVQRGTHHGLLQEPGPYREIYDLQLRDQEEAAAAVARAEAASG